MPDLTKLLRSSSMISKFLFSNSFISVENQWNLFGFSSLKSIRVGDKFLFMIFIENFWFWKDFIFQKCAQFLSAPLVISVGQTVTWYIEKKWQFSIGYYVISCPTSSKILEWHPSVNVFCCQLTLCRSGVWIGMKFLGANSIILGKT